MSYHSARLLLILCTAYSVIIPMDIKQKMEPLCKHYSQHATKQIESCTTHVVFSIPDGYGQSKPLSQLYMHSSFTYATHNVPASPNEYELEIHELDAFGGNVHARYIETIQHTSYHNSAAPSYPATPVTTPKIPAAKERTSIITHSAAAIIATLKQVELPRHKRAKSDPSVALKPVAPQAAQAKK